MGWFWKGRSKNAWSLESVERPWKGGVSIYSHVINHISEGRRGLTEGGETLPDEKNDGEIRWISGGLDGAFGHHVGTGADKGRAKMLHRAIGVVLDDASARKLRLLYDQLVGSPALEVIDQLLERIVEKRDLDADRLEQLAVWLAKNAPDRDAVKFAIALLGLLPNARQLELLLSLGRHEEFTLYAAVAITNVCGDEAEAHLRQLAEQVDGWGRIHVVERLAKTANSEIKAWLLREGYKNSVMNEYLAYACAVGGELRRELASPTIDAALLVGAGDMITALIAGGPAESMDDYADGSVVVQRYMHHLDQHPKAIEQLLVLGRIQEFLEEEKADWSARDTRGWTPALRSALLAKVMELKAAPDWQERVASALESSDPARFWIADMAAKALGIDTWGHHFARLENGVDTGWYFAMQTEDPARVDRVIRLAEERIPLEAISTGPSDSLGLGPEWANHGHLDFVLQDLRRFPGKGWRLIRTGLRSPVVRNRHMALRALSAWDATTWPVEAKATLEAALREEPDEEVRKGIQTVLAGGKLEPEGELSQA
jgi:hypothetical protein